MSQHNYYIELNSPEGGDPIKVVHGYPACSPEYVYDMLNTGGPKGLFSNSVLREESWKELKPNVEIAPSALLESIAKTRESISLNNIWARIDQSIIFIGTLVALLLLPAQDVFKMTQQVTEVAIGSTVATTLGFIALEMIRYNTNRKKVIEGVTTANENVVIKPYPSAVY